MSPFARVNRLWLVGRLLTTVVALPVCAGSLMWLLDPTKTLHLFASALAVLAGFLATSWAGGWLDMWCARKVKRIARRTGTPVPPEWDF